MKSKIDYVTRQTYPYEAYDVHYTSGMSRFYMGNTVPTTVLKFINNSNNREMISSTMCKFM